MKIMRPTQALFAVMSCWLAACSAQPASTSPKLTELKALEVKNLAMPMPNLVTSGQPTEAQFALLAKAGVQRVIQLRVVNEPGTGWEEAKAKELGVEFVRLPMAGAEGLTIENAQRLAAELKTSGDKTTLVCCGSSNRVGALLAMKAFFVDNKSAEEALAFGKSAGLKALEPAVAEKLKK
jgi:protein tyrosine phosphatase (PTP) superfamily phosphohydrolase (DUF442 family)